MTSGPASGVGPAADDFEAFAARATIALRRALVARYGVELASKPPPMRSPTPGRTAPPSPS